MSKTANYGDTMIHTEGLSMDSILSTLQAIEASRVRYERSKQLKGIKHGHNFDYNLKCDCGVTVADYFQKQLTEVCPIAVEYILKNRRLPPWLEL
jgi:hypothetical protein